MTIELMACISRWRWALIYRFAALSKPAKVLLACMLLIQTLLLAGAISIEREAAGLRKELAFHWTTDNSVTGGGQGDYGDILRRFNDFLPGPQALTDVTASLHMAAHEAGITLNTMASQPVAGQSSHVVQRQALRLQVSGEQGGVERFILLALLENDALMLRRWSYQMGIGAMASSTLDFELVTKP